MKSLNIYTKIEYTTKEFQFNFKPAEATYTLPLRPGEAKHHGLELRKSDEPDGNLLIMEISQITN